ncbi:hypothetical protein [Pseudomonas sp. TCU-HL1]|uniref:hypothetical protein n=1 Tax=Pseudomonas sp. TCU-HL1 TaxID=1856685 RepID=UPI00083E5A05|nr:hypothetical protein [Pseudomonas sp. TCU-HL1]AOE88316.1 hypothetical protein THL1_6019 [Pseudomonas sp. TCU-HL1]
MQYLADRLAEAWAEVNDLKSKLELAEARADAMGNELAIEKSKRYGKQAAEAGLQRRMQIPGHEGLGKDWRTNRKALRNRLCTGASRTKPRHHLESDTGWRDIHLQEVENESVT